MANILSLKVENFRSYKNQMTFSFEAVDEPQMEGNYHVVELKNGKQIRILNSAVIYGANAAGKSNVILAFSALADMVKFSKRNDPKRRLKYEPYMFSPTTRKEPIQFKVQFVADGVVYEYEFAYTDKLFKTESLRRVDDGVEVFVRKADGKTIINHIILPDVPDETYLPNHLALSELSLKADPLIQAIYNELASVYVYQMTNGYSRDEREDNVAEMLYKDEPGGFLTNMLHDLITSSDTGIAGISITKLKNSTYFAFMIDEEGKYMWPGKYEVSMLHASEDGDKVPLKLEKESAGTQTLFSAGARVVKALQHGSFLAYDEMNIALHPLVFRRLVKLFNDKTTNPNNAQLLVTTHDTVLIDDVLLRADQVWFAEKTNGVTDLYSAIDFDGVSIDQPFGPWYRAGRLGGRPRLKEGTLGYVGQYNKTQD